MLHLNMWGGNRFVRLVSAEAIAFLIIIYDPYAILVSH